MNQSRNMTIGFNFYMWKEIYYQTIPFPLAKKTIKSEQNFKRKKPFKSPVS